MQLHTCLTSKNNPNNPLPNICVVQPGRVDLEGEFESVYAKSFRKKEKKRKTSINMLKGWCQT